MEIDNATEALDSKETICLQCGGEGYSNAFVYCVKCLNVPIHRYCLDVLPATLYEFVHWVCDDCEVKKPQQLISLNSELIQLESRDNTISEHVEPRVEKKSKRRKTGKVVLDSAEHVSEDVPSEQSYKVDAEIRLTKSVQLASKYSPSEAEQKESHGATPITKKKDQKPPRSSSPQLDDTYDEVDLQHSKSSDNEIPLKKKKTKKKKKKKTARKSSGKFIERLEHSSCEQPCETYIESNLRDHDDSVELDKKEASHSGTENKQDNKNNNAQGISDSFMQRIVHQPFEHPCDPYTEDNLNGYHNSAELERKEASHSGPKNKKKNKNRENVSKSFVRTNGYKPPEQPCNSYAENHLNQHNEPTELEKKKNSKSAAEMEFSERKSCEVNTESGVTVPDNVELGFCPLNESNKKRRVVDPLSADFSEQGTKTQPETPRFGPSHLSSNETLDNHELAQPLADPIWTGSFNILNKEYDQFEGMVVAHLSKKACQKAYEEASWLPTFLDLEMHPKSDIWPKSFEMSEPSDDSIALYFFPMHDRYERMFDAFVQEMLSSELAMRATLKNAELLVFTSTELPLNYWRFQGKYYLWGVFRGKPPSSG